MSNEHNNAPAVPQCEPVHQFRKVHCADWYDGHPDHGDGGGPYEERTLYTAAPSQERCCTCGYLTSEREHLGCLRKAVKDLDAATGGPYPSQPVNRPQNCGTSYCSCIECVCEPEPEPEPVTLTDSYAGVIAWIGDKQCKRVLTEGAIKHEHTPGVAMRNTAHQCVQEVIIAALRAKGAV